jgi:hypothetical protein
MKIKAVVLGLVVGFIAGALIFFMPLPFRSVPYWIRHYEEAGLNRVTTVFFPHPYSTARDVFFVFMGLLHFFIWAVAGACLSYGIAVGIEKLRRHNGHAA